MRIEVNQRAQAVVIIHRIVKAACVVARFQGMGDLGPDEPVADGEGDRGVAFAGRPRGEGPMREGAHFLFARNPDVELVKQVVRIFIGRTTSRGTLVVERAPIRPLVKPESQPSTSRNEFEMEAEA